MFSEDLVFLDLGSYFTKDQGFFWHRLMFSEDLRFLDLGSCFSMNQWFFRLWLMFSEDQRFLILAHIVKGPRIFVSWLMFFRGPKVLDPGSCFQRT